MAGGGRTVQDEGTAAPRPDRRPTGMSLTLHRLPPAEVVELETDDDPESALCARLFGFGGTPAAPDTLHDLHKDWDLLTFALTGAGALAGADGPLAAAVMGSRETAIPGGYGPVRVVDAADVPAVFAALMAVDPAEVAARCTPELVNAGVSYPTPMSFGPDGEVGEGFEADELEDLPDRVPELTAFYRAAADAGEAALSVMA